jgi:hypothetical protein
MKRPGSASNYSGKMLSHCVPLTTLGIMAKAGGTNVRHNVVYKKD